MTDRHPGVRPVDPVQLDPPDDDEDTTPPHPDIPTWEVTSGYDDTTARLTITEDEGAVLTLTHGDRDYGSFQMMRIEIDSADLARLAAEHIAPLLAHEAALAEDHNAHREARDAYLEGRADAAAFVLRSDNLDPGAAYQVRLHRNGCGSVTGQTPRTGRFTHGGTHTAVQITNVLDRVRDALTELGSDRIVQGNLRRDSAAEAGRTRDTAVDHEPLKLCKRCKVLGPDTGTLAERIVTLANVRSPHPDRAADIDTLMTTLATAVWETEQDHLDRLRAIDAATPTATPTATATATAGGDR